MLEGWKNLRPSPNYLEPGKNRYPVSAFFLQEYILSQARKHRYSSLLDIGCGSGTLFLGRKIAFQIRFESISGVDISPHLIEQAQGSVPFMETHVMDIGDFLLQAESSQKHFDMAVMSHVLEMLESPVEVLSRLKSVCEVLYIEFFLPPTENLLESERQVLRFRQEEGGGRYVRTHYSRLDYLKMLGLSGWKLEAEFNSESGWSIHKLSVTNV